MEATTPQTPAEPTPEAGQGTPTVPVVPTPAQGELQKPDPSPPVGEPTFTQEQMNAAAAAARRESEAKLIAGTAELEKYKAEEEEKRVAELSETEKAKEAAAAAQVAQAKAEDDLATANAAALRATLVMAEAPSLPLAYQAQVIGDAEADIKESIKEVRAGFEVDRAALLTQVASMTSEQAVEAYGDAGTALAERFKGKPANIGAPSSGVTTPDVTPPPAGGSPDGSLAGHMARLKQKRRADADEAASP